MQSAGEGVGADVVEEGALGQERWTQRDEDLGATALGVARLRATENARPDRLVAGLFSAMGGT